MWFIKFKNGHHIHCWSEEELAMLPGSEFDYGEYWSLEINRKWACFYEFKKNPKCDRCFLVPKKDVEFVYRSMDSLKDEPFEELILIKHFYQVDKNHYDIYNKGYLQQKGVDSDEVVIMQKILDEYKIPYAVTSKMYAKDGTVLHEETYTFHEETTKKYVNIEYI